jgi:hypothetical protein
VTHDEVVSLLQRAEQIVDEAGLADDLRGAAFVIACRRLAGDPPDGGASSATDASPSDGSAGGSIASRLDVDAGLLARLVDIDGDGVHLVIPRKALATGKRPAMRQLTLLVVALRQAAGTEEWTETATVRDTCQEYGVYDQPNFSTELRRVPGIRLDGPAKDRRLRATVTTFEAAGDLIRELAGA